MKEALAVGGIGTIAVVTPMMLMLVAETSVAKFVNSGPTLAMLASAFLLTICKVLIAEWAVRMSPNATSTAGGCFWLW